MDFHAQSLWKQKPELQIRSAANEKRIRNYRD